MNIDKNEIKRVLVITLSNIGDIILTTPVIKALKMHFPAARVDVMVGPRGKEIFEKDPSVFKLIIYDKHLPITEKRRLQLKLKKLRYDIVVDLRNTVFPLLIGPKYRTATIQKFPSHVVHRRDRHLHRLYSLGLDAIQAQGYIHIPSEDDDYAAGLLKSAGAGEKIVAVNAGARSHIKRWTPEGYAEVADRLIRDCGASVVFIGALEDRGVVKSVMEKMKSKAHDLTDKTNIRQLAGLIKRSRLIITNDSAPLHIGCAVGCKVLAIFGPTDPKKYGPTGEFDMAIFEKLSCSPCESAECHHSHECMKLISPDSVFEAAKMMLDGYE